MLTFAELEEKLPEIEEKLGYQFKNRELLWSAFVHRSYYNENRGEVAEHNERLEFLGDSVLGVMVSHHLYKRFPDQPEGKLSHMRSYLVDASSCATLVQSLELDSFVLLGKGEAKNTGRGRDTILADLFEALIGAIFLDGGMEAAVAFFHRTLEEKLHDLIEQPMRNWKAELQDYAQRNFQLIPEYRILSEEGPDHCKRFHIGAYIGENLLGDGEGQSKKEAETAAAQKAIEALEN